MIKKLVDIYRLTDFHNQIAQNMGPYVNRSLEPLRLLWFVEGHYDALVKEGDNCENASKAAMDAIPSKKVTTSNGMSK